MAETDELLLERLIAVLGQLTPAEREQVVPVVADAVAQHSDAYVRGRLGQTLDDRVASWDHPAGNDRWEGPLPDVEGRLEGVSEFEAREQQSLPSEHEIRAQIDALTLDPAQPEIGFTRAWELAGVIDRLPDPELQTSLRRKLEEQVIALQAHL